MGSFVICVMSNRLEFPTADCSDAFNLRLTQVFSMTAQDRLVNRLLVVPFLMLALCGNSGQVVAAEVIDSAKGVLDSDNKLIWYDAQLLNIEGRGWTDTKSIYDRLPKKAEAIVRPEVWRLSRQSSGICVRFVTDATTIYARWTLKLENLSEATMPATAVSGLDLYVKHEGRWKWFAVGRPEKMTNQIALLKEIPEGQREYLLYLPLYNEVSSLEIGLPVGSRLMKAPEYAADRKTVVFYGTSITQGGCASRPGMVYSAIVGRRLNREVINLGFRANGTMDPEMVPLFAELDPAVYVLDCLPNMTGPVVAERAEPFVRALRSARPNTPIVLAEDRTYPDGILYAARRERNELNRKELKAAFERLQNSGVRDIYYVKGESILGDDGDATVDASHPTDLGHSRQADAFEAVLKPLLEKKSTTD